MPRSKFKKGDKVKVYGQGQFSLDPHNGCRGRVIDIQKEYGCGESLFNLIHVEFEDSFDWFHEKQIRRIVKK